MYYLMHELNHAAMAPWRAAADATKLAWRNPANPLTYTPFARSVAAGAELFERVTRRYAKPEFGIETTVVDGIEHAVRERTVWSHPFCDLVRFERLVAIREDSPPRDDPKLLIVAPMSGHYATLLRGTVEAMLPHAEVHITDWRDARMVPLTEGGFDLDDYIDAVIAMLDHLGPDTHVMAVCQPAVPVLAAVSVMEAESHPCVPATMTLMGGPIDTRINPTAVNKLAEEKPIEWFERRVIMRVPWPHPGFMRPVYPGFLQLGGFMSMNLDRHVTAHHDFFDHLVEGDGDSAEKHREFYDEYLAVMDLTAEFYLQTVETVFIEHALPRGTMRHRGRPVDPSAIRRTALLTIEGENDDISGVGQTEAAHALCSNIPEARRMHHVQERVGHYGIFNGSRFRKHIVPRVVGFMGDHPTAEATGTPPADPIEALDGNETPAAKRRRAEAPAPGPGAPASVKPKRRPAKRGTAAKAAGRGDASAEAKSAPAARTTASGTRATKRRAPAKGRAPANDAGAASPTASKAKPLEAGKIASGVDRAAIPPVADNANASAVDAPAARDDARAESVAPVRTAATEATAASSTALPTIAASAATKPADAASSPLPDAAVDAASSVAASAPSGPDAADPRSTQPAPTKAASIESAQANPTQANPAQAKRGSGKRATRRSAAKRRAGAPAP